MSRLARFGTICKIKKLQKYPWRSVTFSKVAGFSNCANCAKSYKSSHITAVVLYQSKFYKLYLFIFLYSVIHLLLTLAIQI